MYIFYFTHISYIFSKLSVRPIFPESLYNINWKVFVSLYDLMSYEQTTIIPSKNLFVSDV